MNLIQLYVKGISYGGNSDTYLLLLKETNGNKQLPLVINALEAFSVKKVLEKNAVSALPFTHELFKNFLDLLDVHLKDVIIFKFAEGVFHTHLVCIKEEKEFRFPARVGDAVAMAYQTNAPIYIEETLLKSFGTTNILEENSPQKDTEKKDNIGNLKSYLTSELDSLMQDAIENENYELAAQIHNEITRRKTI
ncbi:MAG: bifunctional nuclease family protein [Capnocytophaga sp.]|nr:bifunctional nuclease family protein [Capnocytophaga sp.]